MNLQFRLKIGATSILASTLLATSALLSMPWLPAFPQSAESQEQKAIADPKEVVQAQDLPGKVDIHGDPLPPGALVRMGSARLRGEVLTFSADGKTLITVGADRAFHCWDVATGKELQRKQLSFVIRQDDFDLVHRVKGCSPNGKLYISEDEETIRVWEIASGKEIRKIPNPAFPFNGKTISRLAVTNDGKMVANAHFDFFARKFRVQFLNMGTGKSHILTFEQKDFSYPCFSPDGRILVLGNASGIIRLYDTETAKELRQIKAQPINNTTLPTFSPDGKNLAWIDGSGTVKVWHVADGSERISFPAPGVGNFMQFSPDGKRLAVVGDKGIPVWDLTNNKKLRQLPLEHTGWISRNFYPIAFSPNGRTLAITNRTGALSNLAWASLYDIETGKLLLQPQGHKGEFLAIVFSADGKSMASSTKGETRIHLWDTATGRAFRVLQGDHEAGALVFSPDGKFLFSGHGRKIQCWDLRNGKIVRTFQVNDKSAKKIFGVSRLATDGKKLIALGLFDYTDRKSQNLLLIWNIATGNLDKRFEFPASFLFLFAKDGTTLRLEDQATIRNAATGKHVLKLTEKSYNFHFSWEGRILAIGCAKRFARPPQPDIEMRNGTNLFDIRTGRRLCKIETGHSGTLDFSPDEKFLVVVDQENLSVWEIATAQRVYRLPVPAGFSAATGQPFATFVSFSPDGKSLATGLKDSTILIWDVAPGYRRKAGPASKLTAKTLEQLWADLAGDDAAQAYRAIWTLAASPGQTVPFLKEHIKSPGVNSKHIEKLVADLGSEKFEVRKAAFLELNKFDIEIEPALRQALAKPTEEVRRRVHSLLALPAGIVRGDREILRGYRAIQVLETIGSTEARQVLQTLARGAPAYRLTQEAKASLARLK